MNPADEIAVENNIREQINYSYSHIGPVQLTLRPEGQIKETVIDTVRSTDSIVNIAARPVDEDNVRVKMTANNSMGLIHRNNPFNSNPDDLILDTTVSNGSSKIIFR